MSATTSKPSTGRKIFRILLIASVIAIIVYKSCTGDGKIFPNKNYSKNSSGEEILLPVNFPTDNEAYAASHFYISQSLTNPQSADYPIMGGYSIRAVVQDTSWRISGYVDSQNSLGNPVRKKYYIRIHYLGGETNEMKNWNVLDYRFLN
ncbi:hypothetical protein [Pedobacter sp. L105]|uniref:hypothetical protein n=1 Tax=Pedobacter sp. L105 TaxID=1641871 RepID=UPI00131E09CF|nr:hypothetical protein [Pedobacter sp. L105]